MAERLHWYVNTYTRPGNRATVHFFNQKPAYGVTPMSVCGGVWWHIDTPQRAEALPGEKVEFCQDCMQQCLAYYAAQPVQIPEGVSLTEVIGALRAKST